MFFNTWSKGRESLACDVGGCPASLPHILTMGSDQNTKTVLIKTAPIHLLKNGAEALELCEGQKSTRQLVNVINHPQSLVLEFLDKTLHHASCEPRLERHDIKQAVRTALDGLAFLHAHKRAHTGEN
jgi:hypothetical protein